jgi:hypothetical protein
MNTISILTFIVATSAVAIFTYRIVHRMKKSDNATEEYFTGQLTGVNFIKHKTYRLLLFQK